MQHNLLIMTLFVVLYLTSPILVSAEIEECVINRSTGKITCPPSRSPGARTPQASQPQSFTGRVTQILDHHTLEVTFQGTTMRIHIRPVEDTSKEDLAALALHRDVIGHIRNTDADGLPIADVALPNGENLREALRQRQLQKPEVRARDERKREEEARQRQERLRQQAAEADSNQRALAPFEGRVVKVLDGQTFQVLRQGIPVTVRVRDIPAHVSQDRIRELVGQQTVTIIVYNRTADGRFIGEVILPTGRSLSQEVTPPEMAAQQAKSLAPTVSSSASQAQSTPMTRTTEPATSQTGQGCQSLECQLASINVGYVVTESHQQVSQFRTLLDRIQGKVRNTRQEIADITVKGQQLLRSKGQRIGLLELMQALDTSIPDSAASLGLNFADVAAALVTLMAPNR